MNPLAPERALLIAAVRHGFVAPVAIEEIPPLVAAVNWHRTLWLARRQGVLVALHELLARRAEAFAPAEVRAQLAAFREVDQLRHLARAKELCELQDRFDRAGLAVVWTSRWTLAQLHLPRPALRDSGPRLSCVVEPVEVAPAEALLRDAGYLLDDDPLHLAERDRSHVVVRSRAMLAALWPDGDAPAFTPEIFSLGGRTLRTLSAAGWLLRLSARGADAAAIAPRGAGEIVALLRSRPSLEWPAALAHAEKLGQLPALLRRVAAAHRLLGAPPPPALAEQLSAQSQLDRDAEAAAVARAKSEPAPTLATNPDTELAYLGRFSPTPPPAVTAMLRLADLTAADLVYDLGCGDGRVVVAAARDFGARGIGLDIDPQRIAEAEASAAAAAVGERARFFCADVLRTPVRDASVVFVYLQGFAYPELRKKFAAELRPGTRILSHDFVFPGWPPEKTAIVRCGPLRASMIYLWKL